MIQALFEEQLEGITYSTVCKEISLEFADYVKHQLLQMNIPRYKFIVLVTIGEVKNQDFRMSSRCMWESKFDNQFTVTYTSRTLFAVCIVFGLYHE